MKTRAIWASALIVMLMLTAAITFTLIAANPGSRPPGDTEDPPVGGGNIVFGLPVASSATFTILKDFDNDHLQYNATLRQWRAHRATVVGAAEGTSVLATYNGTVQSVRSTIYGTTVTIDHGNDLRTVFKSLDRNVTVAPGDRVQTGDKIGTVGTTSTVEFVNTPHVRLEVYQNGRRVDPNQFIDFGNK